MAYRFGLLFLLGWLPAMHGQLFLGVCPPAPKHVAELDFELYSGVWFVAATTLKSADRLKCGRIEYRHDRDNNQLKLQVVGNSPFESGSKSGYLKLASHGGHAHDDLELVLDDFPRRWRFYVLTTDYEYIAVEYKCLDGVFKSMYDVTILTRSQRYVDVNVLVQRYGLHRFIPKELQKQLVSVEQEDCPMPMFRPCPRRNTTARGNSTRPSPSPFVTLLATVLTGWP